MAKNVHPLPRPSEETLERGNPRVVLDYHPGGRGKVLGEEPEEDIKESEGTQA